MSNTKYFADLVKVCSVLPALMVMPAMAEVERIVTEVGSGQVWNNKTVSNFSTDPKNGATWEGGLIKVSEASVLTINGGKYTNINSAHDVYGVGGVVAQSNKAGTQVFVNDYNGKRAQFLSNKAYAAGGAMWLGRESNIENADFIGNAVYGTVIGDNSDSRTSIDGGGALFFGSSSTARLTDVWLEGNTSTSDGGAIAMRAPNMGDNSNAKLDIFDTDFVDNSAVMTGGAIYATFYDSVTERNAVYIEDSDFIRNKAETGGAIYNDGRLDKDKNKASMKIVDADFNENTATNFGGAIYNGGNLTIIDSELVGNIASASGGAIYNLGDLSITDAEFINNRTIDGLGDGGAIYSNLGSLTLKNTNFRNNGAAVDVEEDLGYGGAIYVQGGTVDIRGTENDLAEFTGNYGLTGGAIYVSKHTTSTTIKNALFKENWASDIGALGIFGKNTKLDNLHFIGNYTTGEFEKSNDGGGALFFGAVSSTDLTGVLSASEFIGNKSASRGGAISTRTFYLGDNREAYLDISDTNFVGNIATTNGGAIDNFFYRSTKNADAMYVTDAIFDGNHAACGGAVYNHGSTSVQNKNNSELKQVAAIQLNDAIFTGNIASEFGGAIYNETEANVFLSGNNTFTGNTANGVANDIYNDGALTIASGMTSIDGGINGAGALDIKSGATLNMNYASIEQGTINIDGTLMASLLNDKDSVDVTGALSGAGNVLLSAGAAGVYDVSQFTDANLSVDFGKTYQTSIVDGIATLTARQAAEIAADTGASVAAAGAVSGLANVTDAKLQQVSLMMQEALNSGDIETVEQEVAKVNPNKKPVGQSVSSSVQNQVLTVAAGRMSSVGGTTGRAGGDVTGAGVWAQGMFNKTKMGSAFEGNSRGFAMGGDTLIDNVFTLGGGYAYSSTNVLGGGRDIDVESNSIYVYGQYKPAAWYVNSTLTYTESEYSDAANMAAGFALGSDYDIKAYGAQVMTGYDFASGVTPEVGLRYLHTNQGEHENAVGATVREMDMDFLSGVAGLKYAFEIESDTAVKFSPEMRAAMTYDFISDDATATVVFPGAAAYYVDVDRLSRLGGEFGIGLTAEYRGLELSLNYELDLHKDYTSQTGLFKFRYNF